MMFSTWLRYWKRSFESRSSRKQTRRRRLPVRRVALRPRLEALEERTLLSTYLVTNTGDNGGVNPAPGAGTGTLRQAIIDADAANTGTVANPDLIQFAIPTSDPGYNPTTGAFTIQPLSALPGITDPLVLDGYSQAGASVNTLAVGENAVLKIVLDGSRITQVDSNPADTPTLELGANVSVRGLVINNGTGMGVLCSGSGATLSGNFIGTDVSGSLAEGNTGADVWARGSGAIIGGPTPDARNIISGAISGPNASGLYGVGILASGSGDLIEGNYIGTDASGTQSLANAYIGIQVNGATNLTIGGTNAGARNIISGNGDTGISVNGGNTGVKIEGNYIGTDATGEHAVLTSGYHNGITIGDQSGTVVGGPDAGAGNVISGNPGSGIALWGSDNFVEGNLIGTDATGEVALGNGTGFDLRGNGNIIGGTTSASRNIISGNERGIDATSGNPSDNIIEGNYFGTDPSGAAGTRVGSRGTSPITGLGNGAAIFIGDYNDCERNVIGVTASGAGAANVIAYNGTGVYLFTGSYHTRVASNNIFDNGTGVFAAATSDDTHIDSNTITGNGIGVQLDGSGAPAPLTMSTQVQGNQITSNTGAGIIISKVTGITIGGTASGDGNVISANGGDGVAIGGQVTGTIIVGNTISQNTGNGVTVDSSNNTVGGTAAGAGNVISGNSGDGVFVTNGATGVSILGNSISANGGLGIHLDSATNANNNQVAPVLTSANSSSSGTTIGGTLTSAANTTFRVEFFANQSPDPSGYGEGQTFLGFASVTTDANGHASFTATGLAPVPAGQGWTSATATDPGGNTSQFARDLEYNFSGFLPPLSQLQSYSINRNIPIKFQLTDVFGNAVTSLGAVTALQIFNSQGVDVLGGSGAAGLSVSGGTYSYSWHTKGLAAGSYTISVTLADGTTHTKTVQLTASGSSAGLVTDGSGGSATAGALLGGEVDLYVDTSNGDLSSDELARIQDAVNAVDTTIAPYGVVINEVTDPTQANVTLNMDTTSALGGMAQGVLGCTTNADQVTMIQGWNWYAGSDATQVGSGQYDFETAVVHELGHVLGLGHSSSSSSVMYASLATGTANRNLVAADLNVPDSGSGPCALHAVPALTVSGTSNSPGVTTSSSTSVSSNGSSLSGADQLFAELAGLWSHVWNAYETELSSLSVLWQQADALALQRWDTFMSLTAGAMGTRKDTLMRALFFASPSSPNSV